MKRIWIIIGRLAFWLSWPLLWLYLRRGKRTRVLVTHDDQLVLTKGWLSAGKWELPGGGLHKNEAPLVGALRELREETGLALAASQLQFHSTRHSANHGLHFDYDLFTTIAPKTSQLQPQRFEIIQTQWVNHQDLNPENAETDVLQAVRAWWG